jgi:hypothetical protein
MPNTAEQQIKEAVKQLEALQRTVRSLETRVQRIEKYIGENVPDPKAKKSLYGWTVEVTKMLNDIKWDELIKAYGETHGGSIPAKPPDWP